MFAVEKLDAFPTKPGVYLMKDCQGHILYVGKAKNLRQRVRQYFLSKGDGREMIPFLVSQIADIETLVVFSEKEALLVENTLIKQHRPKYNALLKDDKTYIALKVTHKKTWPTLQLVRYKGRPEKDGLYFGPYTSALAARKTYDLLNRLFPLRQCSDQEFARRTRPCILYGLKRCIAPCVGKCTKEEYDLYVDRTIQFLKGQDEEILKDLYNEMQRHADALEFEQAAEVLRTIRQLENTIETQKVDKPLGGDSDVLAIFRQAEEVIISQLLFRDGKLIGSKHHDFINIAEEDHELLESFLLQQYERQEDLPKEIIIPIPLEQANNIEEIISTNKGRKITITTPQRGDKAALVKMAYENAEATFRKEKDAQAIREKTLLEMQEKLRLQHYPTRIECFDNSNLAGTDPVSALVAFTNGIKDTSRYRKYKIRSLDTPDDYATMHEVLTRRYQKAKEENNLPDLLIIDGGKGHLNIALKVFAELNIINVDIIGLAKEQGRHDKGITEEQIFLPNAKDPLILKKTSPILFLLQQIRDEAHRFVLTFHRKRRSKRITKSSLDDIPGIGPAKRRALLRHFGSVKQLLNATAEEIGGVRFVNKKDVEAIMTFKARGGGGGYPPPHPDQGAGGPLEPH